VKILLFDFFLRYRCAGVSGIGIDLASFVSPI